MLNTYRCLECKLEFELFLNSNSEIKCKVCNGLNIIKIFKPLNIAKSDGLFSKKVPSGFKSILNAHAERAGNLNNINTHGIGEI
jgi:DNA-directed RNA polymerase subunit RPC12/RpoP